MSILVGQPRGDVIVFGHRCKRQSRRRTFLKSVGEMKFRWLSVFHIYMGNNVVKIHENVTRKEALIFLCAKLPKALRFSTKPRYIIDLQIYSSLSIKI
jgi:hypothetical protein